MSEVLAWAVLGFVGLAGGLAVGSGLVAFLVVLDIIPRLAQITRSYYRIRWYEGAVILGALFFTLTDFFEWEYGLFPLASSLFGLFSGCFIGMLAAALTEVINVLPILAKRIGMERYIIWLLMAMILGKVLGSMVDWLGVIG
ncbi:Stage V sporulation protein AB [Paenibacillus mucilaginosus 3016]|uniref:Stage V sporulation protein AB n=1 Tax=Paenibacillus mucilaginosus 3016 TaxID=1116391 RepID=H6NMG6_9BACL|nr:stage V sporulation protein AB [Paenibacillus mucilaginosus]AFC29832.1 Stage V sporulation protein AB [Paenibacillus mucilaginosus 3016]WFA18497.1 stage V sporulation protein AB [Paenibacillus mucilaginosus]